MTSLLGLMGYVGIVFLLLGYFLLVIGQLKVTDTHYIMLNMLGALMVVVTLYTGGTLPLFYTLLTWLFISFYGWYRMHLATTE
jgi:hypothetical protein